MNKILLKLITSATLLIASTSAMSIPITGVIQFGGLADVTVTNSEISEVKFDSMFTATKSGSFDSITSADTLKFWDLATNTVSNQFWTVNNKNKLWKVGGFTFKITNIAFNSVDPAGGGVVANGTINHADYSKTAAIFSFNSPYVKEGKNENFIFAARAVPAPATIALLGLALVGFGAVRRKKQA